MAKSPKMTDKPAPAKKKSVPVNTTTKTAEAAPKPAKATKAAKAAPKTTKGAKPAAKVKAPKVTKQKLTAKAATSTNGKTGARGTKPKGPIAARAGTSGPVGDSPAIPSITSPATGSTVTAGVNLPVTASTNRGDLQYDVILQNTSYTPRPPSFGFKSPNPSGSPFTVTIPGANLVSGCSYNITVMVDPMSGTTPPNETAMVSITAE